MSGPTNAERAAWARVGLDAFTALEVQGPAYSGEPLRNRICDMITDLLHLARRECGADMADMAINCASNADCEIIDDEDDD